MEHFGNINNPALFEHLYEDHKDVISSFMRKPALERQHRQRIDPKHSIIRRLRQDQSELRKVVEEIAIAEQCHPFLRHERDRYEIEIQNDPYKRLGVRF
jgi:hypothetical protein